MTILLGLLVMLSVMAQVYDISDKAMNFKLKTLMTVMYRLTTIKIHRQ